LVGDGDLAMIEAGDEETGIRRKARRQIATELEVSSLVIDVFQEFVVDEETAFQVIGERLDPSGVVDHASLVDSVDVTLLKLVGACSGGDCVIVGESGVAPVDGGAAHTSVGDLDVLQRSLIDIGSQWWVRLLGFEQRLWIDHIASSVPRLEEHSDGVC